MGDAKSLVAREREAYVVLSRIRDARATLPEGHPASAPLDEAVVRAEGYWRELHSTVEALERAIGARARPEGKPRAD